MQKSFIKITVLFFVTLSLFFVFPTPLSIRINTLHVASVAKTLFTLTTNTLTLRETKKVKGEKNDRINILFLGIPGKNNSAPYLTDSIIVISIKPSTKQIALISLPRDFLVTVESRAMQTKINALFYMNELDASLVMEKVGEIIGEPIHYYFALDIFGVEKIINAMGGLNVFVTEDILDISFPTQKNGVETFIIKKGWRYFDGNTVQKYLRTRHAKDGDFARMRQQQAVIEALRKRIFGLNLLYDFPTIYSLYTMATRHTQTDLSIDAIQRLYKIAKNISYGQVIQKVIDGDPKNKNALLKSSTVILNNKPAFVLIPKAGNLEYTEIEELVGNIFENLKK